MKAPINSSGYDRKLVPEGTHLAICYQMIQIGTVEEQYMGETKSQHKIMLTFEVPNELIEIEKDGEKKSFPMSISKEYTFSMGDRANLRKDLEGWRGKVFTDEEASAFELDVLLGKPCLINVIHKTSAAGKQRAEIRSISSIMKGMEIPKTTNNLLLFDFGHWDDKVLEAMPEWIRNKIKSSMEYKARTNPALNDYDKPSPTDAVVVMDKAEDDLPF